MTDTLTSPFPVSLVERARFATYAAFLVLGAGVGLWAAHIPTVRARHDIDEGVLGLALLTLAIGAIVAMPLAGALSARFGTRTMTRVGAALYAVAIPLPMLAPGIIGLFAGAAAFGFAMGILDVSMNSHAAEIERARGRPTMSSFHGFFSIGGLVGAGLGGVAIEHGYGDGTGAVAIAVLMLVLGFVAGHFLLPVTGHGESGPHFVLPGRAVIVLGALAGLAYALEGAITDWSALYLADSKAASPVLAASGFALFAATMSVIRLTGDGIVARLGPVPTLTASGVLVALGIGAALAVPSPVLAIIGFAVAGIGAANVVPILFSAAGRVPGLAPAHGIAGVTTFAYAAFLAGPPLVGFVARALGLGTALALVAAAGLIVAASARVVRPAG